MAYLSGHIIQQSLIVGVSQGTALGFLSMSLNSLSTDIELARNYGEVAIACADRYPDKITFRARTRTPFVAFVNPFFMPLEKATERMQEVVELTIKAGDPVMLGVTSAYCPVWSLMRGVHLDTVCHHLCVSSVMKCINCVVGGQTSKASLTGSTKI